MEGERIKIKSVLLCLLLLGALAYAVIVRSGV